MGLFKNSVGRPSNELKEARRIFIISIIAIIISATSLFVCLLIKTGVLANNLKALAAYSVSYGLLEDNKNDVKIISYPNYIIHNGTINFPSEPKFNTTSGKKCTFKGWVFQKLDDKAYRVLKKSGDYAWLKKGDSQIERYAYFGGNSGTLSYRLNYSTPVKLYAAFDCKITTITIEPSITLGGTLKAGNQTEQFNIKTTGSSVKISSSNSKVIAVIQQGNNTASGNKWKLRAKKAGTAKITVKVDNKTKTYKYTVKDTLSTDLSSNETLTAGKEIKEVDVKTTASKVKVSSSNSKIVDVDKKNGEWLLDPKKGGTAIITVEAGNTKKTYTYNVKDTLSTNLKANEKLSKTKEVTIKTTASNVKIISSNSNIIKVTGKNSNWKLKPNKNGTATITVKAGTETKKYIYKVDNGYNKTINAILETANAYYNQGVQIQYDTHRKNLALTPEDATKQHINYTVCSGFTYGVYKNVLGINFLDWTDELLDFAAEVRLNKTEKYVIKEEKEKYKKNVLHYSAKSSSDEQTVIKKGQAAAYLKYVNDKVGKLRPGDIVVYKDKTGFGHAVLIKSVSENKITILEAIGSNYSYNKFKDNYESTGAIKENDLSKRLESVLDSTIIKKFAVIRIVTTDNKCINLKASGKLEKVSCEITDSAKSRLKYKEIDIEKTVDKIVDKNGNESTSSIYASSGDKITYSIKIKNNSDKSYDSLVVAESIDKSLVELEKNSKLSWTINVKPGEEKEIKYTVKVKSGTSGKIIKSTGKVANIPSSTVEIFVGDKLSSSDAESVCTSFKDMKSNTYIERQYINNIYNSKLGINLGINNKVTNLNIIGKDSKVEKSLSRYTKILNTTVGQYIYNNFYGLKIGKGGTNIISSDTQWRNLPTSEFKDRARTINKDMLLDGDVILIEDKESYMYCSGTLFRKDKKDSIIKKEGSNLDEFLSNIVGDNYIILRPYK